MLNGYQCGTVYKAIYKEAQAAAALAVYLRASKTPPSSLLNGSTTDINEKKQVPSVLLTPEWVTAKNMNATVVKDKFVPDQPALHRPIRRRVQEGGDQLVESRTGAACPLASASGHDARDGHTMSTSNSPATAAGSPPDAGDSLLELRRREQALRPRAGSNSVNLKLPPGKATALIGDNGAGKSSLIKTVSGLWAPDAGEILWEGDPVTLHGPKDAEALGITTIYQDLALCDNLDIVQNMFLGHEEMQRGLLNESAMEQAARQTLSDLSSPRCGRSASRSLRCPVASDSPWRSPRRSCPRPSSSSWTSPLRPSASPRRRWC